MKLIKATAQDNEALKSFFNQQVLEGSFDYQIFRPNGFFDQYRLSTDDFHTFALKDDLDEVQALASILFRKAYVNDQEQTVGYVTDLRVSASRSATLSWAKEFVPAFEKLRNERQCQYLFSELEHYESKVYNLLLRRRNRNTKMPRYHLFRRFNLVVIFGRNPFADEPLRSIKIERGQTEDMEPLVDYLKRKSVRRPLRYKFEVEDLERRLIQWPNFSMQNFYIARNIHGDIIGCLAPWNNRDVQQVIPVRYHGKSFQMFSTSQTLSWLGLARPLPKAGQPFNVKYITHGAFDNPDIFYSLLDRAYQDCHQRELIIYPNYYGDFAARPPRSFLTTKIPFGLYAVLDKTKKLPGFLHPNPFTPAPDYQYCFF